MKATSILTAFLFLLVYEIQAQNVWTQKANLGGVARMGAVGFAIGSKGYIGTGGNFSSNYYKDFWEYDPTTDSWTQKADFSGTTRYRALGFAIGAKGYIATGYNGTSYKDVREYDPASNVWAVKANLGTALRFGAVCFVIGNKAYAGTGAVAGVFSKDFWEYDSDNDVWTQKANFGGLEKLYAVGFSIGSYGYLGTGAEWANSGVGTKDIWQYDPALNIWIQKANFPGSGRSEAVAFAIDGYGYIGTGTSYWGSGALADFWKYDPIADSWTVIESYPGGVIEEGAAFVIGCKGYVGTGFINDNGTTVKSAFWELTPQGACLYLPPSSALSSSDSFFCSQECINFNDLSINNPNTWEWNFNGATPSSSSLQNPVNICYNIPGTYDVVLVTSNAFGSDTITLYNFITVYEPVATSISQNNNELTCNPQSLSYQWFFNGTEIPGQASQTLTIVEPGEYAVTTVDSNGCTTSASIIISSLPAPGFLADDNFLCQKFCINFFDQSTNEPVAWQWSFPGGAPSSSTLQNPTNICYSTPGTYNVTLITTNANGNDTLTLPGYITVFATPPFPSITQTGYVLTSTPAFAYQWQLNSEDIPGATNQSHTVIQSGLYTVVVSDSNGCVNSASKNIIITDIAEAPGTEQYSIFPNPSNGNFVLMILNGKPGQEVLVEVINALSQQIYATSQVINSPVFHMTIQLTLSAKGIYLVKVSTATNSFYQKIIVE